MPRATVNDGLHQWRVPAFGVPSVGWWLEQLPLVVLGISVLFLQGYALRFWNGLLGTSGWGISIGLEVLHIWFWYRAAMSAGLSRFAWVVLAVLATALLLGGALHEVSRPLLRESARIDVVNQTRRSLENEARLLTENLAAFRDMAADQGRRGWQDDIRRDTARLQEVATQLRNLTAGPSNTARRPWINQVAQGGVVAVAVLFQIAAVLAIWTISRSCRNGMNSFRPKATQRNNGETILEEPETFRAQAAPSDQEYYQQLWSHIQNHARTHKARLGRGNGKFSQAALAADLGIKAPDLSAIKLLAQGRDVPRKPSRDSVERLAHMFLVEINGEKESR